MGGETQAAPSGARNDFGESVFISQALAGEPVGIAEGASGDWLVRFASVDLGIIDRRSKKLTRFAAAHPHRGEAPKT